MPLGDFRQVEPQFRACHGRRKLLTGTPALATRAWLLGAAARESVAAADVSFSCLRASVPARRWIWSPRWERGVSGSWGPSRCLRRQPPTCPKQGEGWGSVTLLPSWRNPSRAHAHRKQALAVRIIDSGRSLYKLKSQKENKNQELHADLSSALGVLTWHRVSVNPFTVGTFSFTLS